MSSNGIRTNLKCTKPELISAGSEFSKNTKSEILESKEDEMQFYSHVGDMSKEIEELSRKYPDEVFTADMWMDDIYGYTITSIEIISGDTKLIKHKPGYTFANMNNIDSELVQQFKDKVSAYIDNYISTFDSSVFEIPAMHNNKQQKDGLNSYLTFKWETEDHRFTAINRQSYLIEITYENKDRENLEKLKNEVKWLKEQIAENDNSDKEDLELPFQK